MWFPSVVPDSTEAVRQLGHHFKCHVAFIFSSAKPNNDLARVCIDVSRLGNLRGFLNLIL